MVSLTLGQAAVFPMPPEPEAWKYYLVMTVLVGLCFLAVGKTFWNAARPGRHPVATSMALVMGSLFLMFMMPAILTIRGFMESRAADSIVTTNIWLANLLLLNVVVTAIASGRQSASIRFAIVLGGGLLGLIWIGATLPTLAGARLAAVRTQCKNNAKQIAFAIHEMAKEKGELVAPVILDGEVERSWRVELLPWMEQNSLRQKYDVTKTWDADANREVGRTLVSAYGCPANPAAQDSKERLYSAFAAVKGPGTIWSTPNRVLFPAVPDGASQTILFVEASGRKIVWTEPRDVDASVDPIGVNLPGSKPGESPGLASGFHGGGCYVAMADGSVRFVSQSINKATLQALTTAAGSDSPGEF